MVNFCALGLGAASAIVSPAGAVAIGVGSGGAYLIRKARAKDKNEIHFLYDRYVDFCVWV